MRILISNDDGIYSPGITALAKVASRFGEVRIVAPDVEQSIDESRHHLFPAAALQADFVRRFRSLSRRRHASRLRCARHRSLGHVDLVLSGINLGPNLGNSCWHSGTLAAAKQAALLESRGIALSAALSDNKEPDFAALEPYVTKVVDLLLEEKNMGLVNVNFPGKPNGIRWTRQSVRHYDGKVVAGKGFTITPLQGAEEGTDRWAVEHNWVSITPLRLDLTDEKDLARALALPQMLTQASKTRKASTGPRRKSQKRGSRAE